jgi:PAS domain S-box-containing protein
MDQLILPEDKERVIEWIFARQRGDPVSDRYEYRIRLPDGEIRTVQIVSASIYYKGQRAVAGVIRDITDTKLTETTLRVSKELLVGILDNSAEAIISTDEAQQITMFNKGAEQIFGYSAVEVLGKPIDTLLPERLREVHRRHIRSFAAAPEKSKRISKGVQVFGRRKDGSEFPVEASISKLNLSGRIIFTVILWDITERKKAEEELKRSREELRALAVRLQHAREEESARVARTIHDELSGALTALNMELSLMPGRVTQDLHQLLEQNASSMSEQIQRILERVRTIATEIRPAVLDQFGLIAAIEWESQEFQRRSEIRSEVLVPDEEILLDPERSTAVFRIFQEALTNIALHAYATKVAVNVK